jgi:hypothetical protein
MKKLTLRNYLGYAAGDLANNLAFSLQALLCPLPFLLCQLQRTGIPRVQPVTIKETIATVRQNRPL